MTYSPKRRPVPLFPFKCCRKKRQIMKRILAEKPTKIIIKIMMQPNSPNLLTKISEAWERDMV